ncbi:hypothetical protein [Shewanella halifaxensis]|uniref:hypothetical protein n=1 Tax=Shewanella halifaxensis TaxID=271098 RepID=UPI000D595921|nr:hypothetical protein [Shewanella halifaxensis]
MQIAEKLGESEYLIATALKPFKSNNVVIKLGGTNRQGFILALTPNIELSMRCETCDAPRYVWMLKQGKCPMCANGVSINKAINDLKMANVWFQLLTKPYAEMEFEHDSQSA